MKKNSDTTIFSVPILKMSGFDLEAASRRLLDLDLAMQNILDTRGHTLEGAEKFRRLKQEYDQLFHLIEQYRNLRSLGYAS